MMATYPKRLQVTNPSFETGAATPGDGWTTLSGSPAFRNSGPPPDPRGGTRYLVLDNPGASGTWRVRQDLPIPAECLADVDAAVLAASMRFLWSNLAAGNDIGFVELAFLDAADAVLATVPSGSFPDSPQTWTSHAFAGPVPSGARKVRLVLGGTWVTGNWTDSYFDVVEAELVVAGEPAGKVLQAYAEALATAPSGGRVGQGYAEALVSTSGPARASQIYAELIRSVADKPATATGGTIVCVVLG
jgi:hypothetical protein